MVDCGGLVGLLCAGWSGHPAEKQAGMTARWQLFYKDAPAFFLWYGGHSWVLWQLKRGGDLLWGIKFRMRALQRPNQTHWPLSSLSGGNWVVLRVWLCIVTAYPFICSRGLSAASQTQ